MNRSIVGVIAFVTVFSAAVFAYAQIKENDLERLAGTWLIVGAEFEGSEEKCELKKGEKFVFDGKKYKFESKAYPEEGNFAVEGGKAAKEINFVDTKDKKSHGIYELEGEELKICFWHGERPTQFKSGKAAILVNLKRHR